MSDARAPARLLSSVMPPAGRFSFLHPFKYWPNTRKSSGYSYQRVQDRDDNDDDDSMAPPQEVVVTESSPNGVDAAMAKRVLRKIDMRLIPLLFVTYGLNFMDKTILSSASVFGLQDDTVGYHLVLAKHVTFRLTYTPSSAEPQGPGLQLGLVHLLLWLLRVDLPDHPAHRPPPGGAVHDGQHALLGRRGGADRRVQ